MKNLAGLMKQASQMQAKMQEMQERLETMEVEGSAGAGMVIVRMNGKFDMRGLTVDPKLLDPSDVDTLRDLIIAAHADAKRKVEAMTAEEMQKITGGLELPGGMKLPF